MQEAFSVEYQHVSKKFGQTVVLEDISLALKPGEFTVFVGPSGSGKSTLLRILAGLETADSGRLLIGDTDVTHLLPKDRDVAMVFQNYALYSHMSVAENITFGMRLRNVPKEERLKALEHVVKILHLDGLLERKPGQLSGGQRQRVAMARAIVRNPKVFLMDEPLSNLDAKLRNEVREAITSQQRKLGVTTIYVTHDQVEAMTMAHRIVVLRQGRIQQIGTPEELYHTPINTFVAGFIGNPAMNFIQVRHDDAGLCFAGGMTKKLEADHPLCARPAGTSLVAGIRPEHLQLQGVTPLDEQSICINAQVRRREMLGAEYILQLRDVEGAKLQMRMPSNLPAPNAGENVSICFSARDVHFFDSETQERIM